MTRKALAARAAGAFFSSGRIHLPYHASENPPPQITFRYALSQNVHATLAASFRRGGPPAM